MGENNLINRLFRDILTYIDRGKMRDSLVNLFELFFMSVYEYLDTCGR